MQLHCNSMLVGIIPHLDGCAPKVIASDMLCEQKHYSIPMLYKPGTPIISLALGIGKGFCFPTCMLMILDFM